MMRLFLCLVITCFLSLGLKSQTREVNTIALIFKTGNTELLADFLSENVSVGINKSEKSYSKAQANQVVKSFLERNKPTDFIYRHSGKSDHRDQFNVGQLKTVNGDFRITYFLIETKGGFKIKRLRIEPK